MFNGKIVSGNARTNLQIGSARNKQAVTLIEVLIVVVIVLAVTGLLFSVLRVGYLSETIGTQRLELQERMRRVTGWLVRDLRQTTLQEIKANDPSNVHLKFRRITGYNVGSQQIQYEPAYIEYNYDGQTKVLTRTNLNTGFVQQFSDFTNPPFKIDGAWVSGDDRMLELMISLQKTIQNFIPVKGVLNSVVTLRTSNE